jgi:hypothetical protein
MVKSWNGVDQGMLTSSPSRCERERVEKAMTTLTIHDLKEHALAFDLRDLLRLLAPRSLQATWVITTVKSLDRKHEWFDATGDGGEQLERLARENTRLSGSELLTIADRTRQVIWGEFIASFPVNPEENWVIVRALDSSFYEITTRDEAVLETISSTFEDVRHADAPTG